MAWQDRDYGRSQRPDPDDDDPSVHGDHLSRPDDDDESGDFGDDSAEADIDPEAPDASDRDDYDEPALISCPSCRKKIVEDAEQCHYCGDFIEDAQISRLGTWWIWVAGVVLAMLVIRWVIWL